MPLGMGAEIRLWVRDRILMLRWPFLVRVPQKGPPHREAEATPAHTPGESTVLTLALLPQRHTCLPNLLHHKASPERQGQATEDCLGTKGVLVKSLFSILQ